MLGWIWNMFGMFNLIKLLMWDIPFMSAKFTYYIIKYSLIAMYHILKFNIQLVIWIYKGLSAIIRVL